MQCEEKTTTKKFSPKPNHENSSRDFQRHSDVHKYDENAVRWRCGRSSVLSLLHPPCTSQALRMNREWTECRATIRRNFQKFPKPFNPITPAVLTSVGPGAAGGIRGFSLTHMQGQHNSQIFIYILAMCTLSMYMCGGWQRTHCSEFTYDMLEKSVFMFTWRTKRTDTPLSNFLCTHKSEGLLSVFLGVQALIHRGALHPASICTGYRLALTNQTVKNHISISYYNKIIIML